MIERVRTVVIANLRLPSTRRNGADPFKLARQIGRFGGSSIDMPPIQTILAGDGELIIWDGVTRAIRLVSFHLEAIVDVVVIDAEPALRGLRLPRVKDRL